MSPRARYNAWATQAARQYGVPVGVFKSLITHESGWNPRARSPVGALGIAQFMPDTARGLGINPLNPRQAIFAAAKYLAGKIHHYGDVRLALASYNAGDGAVQKYGGIPPFKETQDYVHKIMRDAPHYGGVSGSAGTGAVPGFTVTRPSAPDFRSAALANLEQMTSQHHADPLFGLQNILEAVKNAGTETTHVPGTPGTEAPHGPWAKYVRMASGADRGGVHTVAPIKQFVGELGSSLGRPLTITTGTNHNEYVVGTQRQSAHWTGHAVDISMSGKALTRAGQRALILAGMPAAQARKIRGGLFNVGGYQIIFNTNEGGNHFNHLHVGLRH